MFAKVKAFLAPVPGGLRGFINAEELARSVVTAIVAGLGTGGGTAVLTAILTTISADATSIFAGPFVGVATSLIGLALELLRRKSQGSTRPVLVNPPFIPPVQPAPG
jgi:hypothetical protein